MLKHITEDFGNGGTIDGDVIITGDLQVSGGGSLSFDEVIEGTQVIDVTNTEALLVRKNSDGGDIFTVDTSNSEVELGVDVKLKIKDSSYSGQLSVNSNGYTELQALGDRSIDLKSQRQIRMFTSDDGASYTQALNLSSTGGNATFLGTLTVGADGSGKDVIFYSATAGDSFAWDASEEKLTITGTNGQTALDVADGNLVVADNVDIEGDIDVNGTTNLDAVDIDGNVQLDGTFTVGTDGSGQDVTFYSATSGDSFAWDASEEKLTITGTDGALALDIADGFVKVQESLSITNGSGSFYVWSDDPFGSNYEVLRIDKPSGANARLSVYKGGTGTYRGLSLETGSSGEGIIIDSSSNVAIANNLDVDGTTNLDAVDIDGAVDMASTLTMGGNITMADDTSIGIADDAERIEFDGAGDISVLGANFGIGVSDPDSELEIFHATDPQIKFSINTHGDAGIMLGDADGLKLFGKGASNQLRLYSGASTLQAQIDSNGITFNDVVDITDTTDASDDSGDTGALRVEGGASIAKKLYVGGTTSLEGTTTISSITTLVYETNQMTLTRDGGHLMVLRNSGSAIADGEALGYYRFNGKVGGNDEEVGVDIRAEADGAWTADTDCPARLKFSTNSGSGTAERMRIDKDGVVTLGLNDATATSVGIGASPSVVANTSILHVGNHNTAVAVIYLTDNEAQDDFFIQSNSELRMGYNNTTYHSMGTTGIAKWTSNTNSNLSIDTASATSEPRIIAINDAESAYVTLGLYADPLELKRGRLKFPATQVASSDANTLDDYEEGVFEVAVTGQTSGSWTTTSASGYLNYIKIGKLCHISGYIEVDTDNSANGNLKITLPFTSDSGLTENADLQWGSGTIANGGTTITAVSSGVYIPENQAHFLMFYISDAGTYTYYSDSNLDDTWIARVGFTYRTNA